MELVRGPEKSRNFTILGNPVINDDRLPFRALGLLTFLLSKPEGWRADATLLSLGEGREGRDAIRSALTSLEVNGYLVRTRRQTDRGRWMTETVIHENPQVQPKTENQASVSTPPNVVTRPLQPKTENQASVFQALSNKELEERTDSLLQDVENSPVDNHTDKIEPKDSSSDADNERKLKGELRDEVVRTCELDPSALTRSAKGSLNRAVVDLVGVEATPAQVHERAGAFRRRWPDATLTPSALAKHWPACGGPTTAVQESAGFVSPHPQESCPQCVSGWIEQDDGLFAACSHSSALG
jgi:hypothetical protein